MPKTLSSAADCQLSTMPAIPSVIWAVSHTKFQITYCCLVSTRCNQSTAYATTTHQAYQVPGTAVYVYEDAERSAECTRARLKCDCILRVYRYTTVVLVWYKCAVSTSMLQSVSLPLSQETRIKSPSLLHLLPSRRTPADP